jgi:hypothetical protein
MTYSLSNASCRQYVTETETERDDQCGYPYMLLTDCDHFNTLRIRKHTLILRNILLVQIIGAQSTTNDTKFYILGFRLELTFS